MSKQSIVPFGPQHPVLPEPIHIDLVLEDEKVIEAVPSIGFVHRCLEMLADKKEFTVSETEFFHSRKAFKTNILKDIKKKRL